MFGNSWFKKEKPILGYAGFGGGATSVFRKAGGVGKFTIDGGTEYTITEGYSSPVPTDTLGGDEFTMEVTAGPFEAVIKLWGAGGGVGANGGSAGSGGYVTATFEFLVGETYHWVAGGGGKRGNEGSQPIGGGGAGYGSPGPQGSGGGGGGYTGLFKAPAPLGPPGGWKDQDYVVLMAGGGGGGGQTGNSASYHEPRGGGAGGAVYPPAAAPFGTNFGGGRGQNPNQSGPSTNIVGQYAEGPGNQGGGAPLGSGPPYGGEGGGVGAQQGAALTGADRPYSPPMTGGAGGGGGYWGGGSGGNPTGKSYNGGGGGGGFATVAPVHPEGIACTNVSGLIARHTGSPSPYTTYANSSDPDWGGAGKGAQYKNPEGTWNDENAGGRCGRVVIKAPA